MVSVVTARVGYVQEACTFIYLCGAEIGFVSILCVKVYNMSLSLSALGQMCFIFSIKVSYMGQILSLYGYKVIIIYSNTKCFSMLLFKFI